MREEVDDAPILEDLVERAFVYNRQRRMNIREINLKQVLLSVLIR